MDVMLINSQPSASRVISILYILLYWEDMKIAIMFNMHPSSEYCAVDCGKICLIFIFYFLLFFFFFLFQLYSSLTEHGYHAM